MLKIPDGTGKKHTYDSQYTPYAYFVREKTSCSETG